MPMSMKANMITRTTTQVRRCCSEGGKGFLRDASGVDWPGMADRVVTVTPTSCYGYVPRFGLLPKNIDGQSDRASNHANTSNEETGRNWLPHTTRRVLPCRVPYVPVNARGLRAWLVQRSTAWTTTRWRDGRAWVMGRMRSRKGKR